MNLVEKITNTKEINETVLDEKSKWMYEKLTGNQIEDLNAVTNNERLLLTEINKLNREVNEMAKMYLTSKEGEACFR